MPYTKGILQVHPHYKNDLPMDVICDDGESWVTLSLPLAVGEKIIGEVEFRTTPKGFLHVDTEAECRANARRLIACWNACQGLETDLLESILCAGDTILGQCDAMRAELTEAGSRIDSLLTAFAAARDAILNGRGALEAALDGDSTNAVLYVLDDAFSASIDKATDGAITPVDPSEVAPVASEAVKELPPLPEPAIEGTVMHPDYKICYLAPVHFTADQMQAYARAAIAKHGSAA